ncbi:unnamed protein product [Notodromas monacha]|uniref:Methyltransferase type 11 domain-containing protein n=1 Tax=Notodromas monacha TaxID=399045 RepID=A0A7R9BW75_9CRUS|nr:unnamed protein product [Notodromas monacha]CAG0921373.1 unnamed protein product [Notodromas monacha]
MMFNASGKLVITLGVAAVGVYGATNALHLDELLNANLFHFSSRAFSEIAQDSKEAHFAVLRSKNAKQDTMMMTREREDADYLKVVEIGIGIGANFQFMPSRTAVIGVDPNPYFEKFVRRNADKYPNVRLESFIVGKGENLEDISSSSADVVITTLVLCQTKDKRKFLAEILRILVPGGKYFFWEHLDAYVRSAETDSNRKLLEHHSKDRSPHDRRGYYCRRFTLLMDYCYITLGENLEDISSSSADVVITTLVLCQTKDKRKFLAEILRILVPGGKYLFWEHLDAYVRSAETDSNRKLLEHHSKDRSPHDRRGYH